MMRGWITVPMGGPLILSRKTDELKSKYLIDLCRELYLKDIEERHGLRGDNRMAALVNILASAVESLTNPLKLANTFDSNGMHVSDKTILWRTLFTTSC